MPLTGVRVLDLSRLAPGPFCTQLLGDLGADVIKVEECAGGDYLRWWPPLVDGLSASFWALNRNKRSVALDLRDAVARDAFLRLIDGADVLVDSFRPGVLGRLGLDWPVLHRRNPRLVLCSITGYGQDGPYRERAGHDLNYQALSGVLSTGGTADGRVGIPGVQIADLGTGAMSAVVAILAALRARDRTGEGQWCDVAMLDGLVSWLALQAAQHWATGAQGAPGTALLNGRHPCYALYNCADGQLTVAALEPKFWSALTAALGLPELEGHAFDEGDGGARVHAALEAVFVTRTRAEWAERLAGLDVCCEPVLHLDEALEQDQVVARDGVLPAGTAGPLPQTGFPFRLSATPPRVRRRAPALGEHTDQLLAEAGVDAATVAGMRAAGAAR
ncbi:MAG: CaiB/BaiF CoA transferase family protein [Candidatus Dormibacteria bacterium]